MASKVIQNSMEHWNGAQMCAIDTETTGLDFNFHEVIQICILPLDSNILPRKDVQPFYLNIKPDYPERADPRAMKINRLKMAELIKNGHDSESAAELLHQWVEKLGLPYTKSGIRKHIIPVGQNYAFDMPFLKKWLGSDTYFEIFGYHYRDTMLTAAFMNDYQAYHAETVPFPKISLNYLCNMLNISSTDHHDSLADCVMTAEIYRTFVRQGIMMR